MTMQVVAVVPIFMSAGAAVLPTVMAAAASVAAIVVKPWELARVARRRPGAASAVAGVLIAGAVAGVWWMERPAAAAGGAGGRRQEAGMAAAGARIDWAKVAEELIAQEQAGRRPTALGSGGEPEGAVTMPVVPPVEVKTATPADPATADGPSHATVPAALPAVAAADFSRNGFDGGASPAKLKVQWAYRPEDTMFLAKPALGVGAAAGKIFTAGCESDLGGYVGILTCLNAATGKQVWQTDKAVGGGADGFLKAFFSSPALSADGKSLVVGQGLHQDRDCSLLCFDTATGQVRWAVKTSLHIESSPAVRGDVAVVGAGAIEGPDGRPTGDAGHVIAVRISDGKELWRHGMVDPESSPAIGEDGTVYIGSGFNGNAVVALRGETDAELKQKNLPRQLWRAEVGVPVTGAITLAGDLAIAGGGNGDFVHSNANARGVVVGLDRKTGEVKWKTPTEDSVLGGIAYKDGVVICPVRTGEVLALAAETGKVLWRARVSGKAPVLGGCAFTGTRVYAVSSDGYLAVLDAKDGKVLEKVAVNAAGKPGSGLTACPPQVVGGRLIVGSETGGLQCFVGTGGAE